MTNQNQYNIKIVEYDTEIRYKLYKKEVKGNKKKSSLERIKTDMNIWEYAKRQFSIVVNQLYEIDTPELMYLDVIETEYKNEFLAWLEVSQEEIIKEYENIQKITRETFVQEFIYKEEKSLKDSKSRSIQKVYDIGKSNKWDCFLTITFNEDKVSRYDYIEVTKKFSKWLNNYKTDNQDFKYIAVPELHQGEKSEVKCSECGYIYNNNISECPECKNQQKLYAYHFHLLASNMNEDDFIKTNNKTKSGLTIYNLDKYKFGFTTATKITDSNKAVGYICKYLTKELIETVPKGKKRYWTSKNVELPKETNIYISPEHIEQYIEQIQKEKKYKYLKEINIDTPQYKNKLTIIEFEK